MERKSRSTVESIFKFSIFCNILPYFDHLHEWRVFGQINKKSRKVWNDNYKAFMNCGSKYRQERYIDDEKEFCRTKQRSSFYKMLELSADRYAKPISSKSSYCTIGCKIPYKLFIQHLVNKLDEGDALILDEHETKYWLNKIIYCAESQVSQTISAINCPHYRPCTKSFKLVDQNAFEYIQNQSELSSIIIRKSSSEITVETTASDTYWLAQRDEEYPRDQNIEGLMKRCNACSSKNCSCKPSKLSVSDNDCFDLAEIVKSFPDIKQLNHVYFDICRESRDGLFNLLRFKKQNSKLELQFRSQIDEYGIPRDTVMYKNSIDCSASMVLEGEEWVINPKGNDLWFNGEAELLNTEIYGVYIVVKISALNIINSGKVHNIICQNRPSFITDFKERTKTNNDIYLIVHKKCVSIDIKYPLSVKYSEMMSNCHALRFSVYCNDHFSLDRDMFSSLESVPKKLHLLVDFFYSTPEFISKIDEFWTAALKFRKLTINISKLRLERLNKENGENKEIEEILFKVDKHSFSKQTLAFREVIDMSKTTNNLNF